jgi:MoaA/NifB/PqqE/SkfB family radical SAM enzyme
MTAEQILCATVSITGACNFNCVHCYFLRGKSPSFEKVANIIKQLGEAGCFRLHLTGGEPFLRQDLIKVAGEARRQRFFVQISTNATCIDKKTVEALKRMGVRHYYVSIYGGCAETYERLTGNPDGFDRMCKGLEILLNSGAKVLLAARLMKQNFTDIDKISRFFQDITHRYPQRVTAKFVTFLFPRDRRFLCPWYGNLDNGQIKIVQKQGYIEKIEEAPFCKLGYYHIYINICGDVLPCCLFKIPAGNLHKEPLQRIWNESRVFSEVRNHDVNSCKTCQEFKCPAMCYNFHKGYGDN